MDKPLPRVDISSLSIDNELGSGGQGRVFRVRAFRIDEQWPAVIKIYSATTLARLDVTALERIAGLPHNLSAEERGWLHDRCAWPAEIVEEQGKVRGFLMRQVPSAFYFDFRTQTRGVVHKLQNVEFLLNSDDYRERAGLAPVTDKDRIELLMQVARYLSRLHYWGAAIGDLSPKNVLFSLKPDPASFFIDCDAVKFNGDTALSQVETTDWEAPPGEPRATIATDSYKFGLLAVRLFARDQATRSPSAIAAISPELAALARRSQHSDPHQRPKPREWLTALKAAASSAPTTPGPATASYAAGPSSRAYPRTDTGPAPKEYPSQPWGGGVTSPPPTRFRRRPAVLALSAACVLAVVAVIALRAMTATAAPFSHSCLVGTWRNGARYSSVTANGHLISLYGGAGNVDHIFATGKDDESWAQSQPLYGKYQGHTLKEIIRGQNTLTIRRLGTPGKVSITEDGWSSGSSNTFSYQGGTYPGSMNNGGASKVSYHCTAHTLVWRHENGAIDQETRISRTP